MYFHGVKSTAHPPIMGALGHRTDCIVKQPNYCDFHKFPEELPTVLVQLRASSLMWMLPMHSVSTLSKQTSRQLQSWKVVDLFNNLLSGGDTSTHSKSHPSRSCIHKQSSTLALGNLNSVQHFCLSHFYQWGCVRRRRMNVSFTNFRKRCQQYCYNWEHQVLCKCSQCTLHSALKFKSHGQRPWLLRCWQKFPSRIYQMNPRVEIKNPGQRMVWSRRSIAKISSGSQKIQPGDPPKENSCYWQREKVDCKPRKG